jgi:mRNA-degrading endonuclease RelE of RelBE toxin-antitoxin system
VHGRRTRGRHPADAGAGRIIQNRLGDVVAAAVIEFITGTLLDNPPRVGTALRNELTGVHSVRRGAFRVLYEIGDGARRVTVLRVEHRADVYGPR